MTWRNPDYPINDKSVSLDILCLDCGSFSGAHTQAVKGGPFSVCVNTPAEGFPKPHWLSSPAFDNLIFQRAETAERDLSALRAKYDRLKGEVERLENARQLERAEAQRKLDWQRAEIARLKSSDSVAVWRDQVDALRFQLDAAKAAAKMWEGTASEARRDALRFQLDASKASDSSKVWEERTAEARRSCTHYASEIDRDVKSREEDLRRIIQEREVYADTLLQRINAISKETSFHQKRADDNFRVLLDVAEAKGVFFPWQTIETAPKDGTVVLLGHKTPQGFASAAGFWGRSSERWCLDGGDAFLDATHWMFAPKAPAEKNK